MKLHILILFCLMAYSSVVQGKENIINDTLKTAYIIGIQPSKIEKTNGLHFDFRVDNIRYSHLKDKYNDVTVNGLNFKTGLINMMMIINLENQFWKMVDSDSLKNFDLALQHTNMWINGINISGVGTLGSTEINGLSVSGAITTVNQVNGISVAGLTNFSYILNGISIATLRNHSIKVNGVQIGIYNKTNQLKGIQIGLVNKSTNTKGLQIGLINKNEKRTMILINW